MSNGQVKNCVINLKDYQLYRFIELYENGLLSQHDDITYMGKFFIMLNCNKKHNKLIIVYTHKHDVDTIKRRVLASTITYYYLPNIQYTWSDDVGCTFLSRGANIICRLYCKIDKYNVVFNKTGMDLAFKLVMYNNKKTLKLLTYLYPPFNQEINIEVNKGKNTDAPSISITCDVPRYVIAQFLKQICIYNKFDDALKANINHEIDLI